MQRSRFKAEQVTSRAHEAQRTSEGLAPDGEEGYLLLGAIIAIALVMIALSVAAVKVSFELRREREEESVRRADQYVRAIRRYYLKFGHYPGSIEQLENTNNIRFLRKKYFDPLTGKQDYRLIIVGQNKTTPTGFFGEPLSGLPGSGPGAGAGGTGPGGAGAGGTASNSPGGVTAPGGAFGSGNGNIGTMGFGSGTGITAGTPSGAQTTASDAAGAPGSGSNPSGSSSTTGSGPPGSNLGPIMGVGTSATGTSIITVNEQTTYDTWEFLYDPRVERLRQAGQLNQGVGTGGGGNPAGLGSAPQSGTSSGATPGAGGTSAQPGGTPSSGTQPTQP